MSKINASYDFDRVPEKEVPRYVAIFCEQVQQALARGLTFEDNFFGNIITATFANSNTDGNYNHNLGKVPTGYIVCGTSVAMNVFDGTQAATSTQITLQASAAGVAKILVF